ncbi:peptidoglycan DD-metalloendopeptidase family protein, partial [Arthrospira platensis SPKY2]
LDLALAAYNAGPGRVDSCGRCIPGNHGYVSDVKRLWDYYTIMSLIPEGARITHDNKAPRPYKGVDYVLGCQSPIYAPVDGVITGRGHDGFVGPYGANNSFLILRAADFDVIFLHGRYSAAVGQPVHRGDLLGYEASIGNSTGCHTDISIRRR